MLQNHENYLRLVLSFLKKFTNPYTSAKSINTKRNSCNFLEKINQKNYKSYSNIVILGLIFFN